MAVMDVMYLSCCLKRYVKLKVILPLENTKQPDPDFTTKPDKFKTLYLLHGFSGCEEDWLYGSHIFKLARDNNLAVVMPAGENSFYTNQKRKGVDYGRFIAEELVKATRRMLPLSDRREDTFIGGLSMGAFGSLLLGSRFSDTFSAIIGLSGVYDLADPVFKQVLLSPMGFTKDYYDDLFGDLDNPDPENDPLWVAREALRAGKLPRIYMACGTEDPLYGSNLKTVEALKAADADITWEQDRGAHDWYFWDDNIAKAVDWCLKG